MAASAAASTGGAIISRNESAQNAANIMAARNSVLMESRAKQKEFANEARGAFDTGMTKFTPENQAPALDNAQTARTEAITSNISGPGDAGNIPLSGSAPEIVKGTIAKRMLEMFTNATDKAKRLGRLGGYDDTTFGNNLGVTETGRKIGTINDFSRGTAALLPYEQDFAEARAARSNSIWGPLLMGAGAIGGAAAGGMNWTGTGPNGVIPDMNAWNRIPRSLTPANRLGW